jgi:hypothetical protein
MKIERADTGGRVWHQLWTVRVAFGWGAIESVKGLWDDLSGVVPWWAHFFLGLAMAISLLAARLLKQGKGQDDGGSETETTA